MKKNKNIAILGGGNIGTQFACVCASKGHDVRVYSSKPDCYDGTLTIVDENKTITCSARINMVSNVLGDVLKDCDIVLVTYPAFYLSTIAKQILPYASSQMSIGVIPGTGGAEFAFADCIEKGATLFGLQRVPAVARLIEYGKCVQVTGKRDKLHLAAIPRDKAEEIADVLSNLFDMECEALPNYLCVTMTPSNPILHTTRLCTMFADYVAGKVYERNFLFYGEWSDTSSALLLACDEEHQQLCHRIEGLDLSSVRSLKLHYESDTIEKMTKKIQSIKSLNTLTSPMKKLDDGSWIPDFKSRYFTADFPYGLAIIEELARVVSYDVPNIQRTMEWYRNVTGDNKAFSLCEYNINTVDDVCKFYSR